ncbi:MAG: GDP-mannose 4,6-dehydratase [Chitinispirillaceae bacterium]|nr:GDP-mannose 4,6-dehydratase [Chitinispirillaceae bacterium]
MAQKQKALITGSNGFVGGWLSELLIQRNFEVLCTDIQETNRYPDRGIYRKVDITHEEEMADVVAGFQPDAIYHLAGVSYLPQADRSPKQSIDSNISGTLSVLDAVKSASPQSKVLLIGSSKEYNGSITSDGVSERKSPHPTNFYGITKYAAELLGLQYHRQFGLDIRCTRSFNHTGPGQSPHFVCSDWAQQVAEIAGGRPDASITVGEIDVTIDFTDVRDVVAAYMAIIEKGQPGEVYNVCSGSGISLNWILDYLCNKSPVPVSVHYHDEKKRDHRSNKKIIGSHAKLTAATGWKPAIPFERTLDDLYAWWLRTLEE